MNFPRDSVCTDVVMLLMHAICNEHQRQSVAQTALNVFFLGIIHTLRRWPVSTTFTLKHSSYSLCSESCMSALVREFSWPDNTFTCLSYCLAYAQWMPLVLQRHAQAQASVHSSIGADQTEDLTVFSLLFAWEEIQMGFCNGASWGCLAHVVV